MELLLSKGADVSAKDSLDQTPFEFAIQEGRFQVTNALLKHGKATKNKLLVLTLVYFFFFKEHTDDLGQHLLHIISTQKVKEDEEEFRFLLFQKLYKRNENRDLFDICLGT